MDFIQKAKEIHGDQYDYSKTKYVKSKEKVIIICPEHGEFEQTPKNHLNGQGCRQCGIDKIKQKISGSNESFIEKARQIHNNKYNYSKVDYKRSSEKVTIICPSHGKFEQTPNSHLKHGCRKCVIDSKLDHNFVDRAKEIHGDKYNYSKVKYVNSYTKIKIICPEHGEFEQTPHSHLNKNGCKKCNNTHQYTTEEFIKKARQIHGNKYDYSKTKYKNANSKVTITCPEHGEFEQIAFVHLSGSNCSRCVGRYKYTTKEFIEKSKQTHGNKYDYSKVKYVNSYTKVTLICPTHGKFEQTPSAHLKHGCSDCIAHDKNRFLDTLPKEHKDLYDYSKVNYINDYTKIIIICPKHGEFEQTPSNHKQGHGCPKCPTTFSNGHLDIYNYIVGLGYQATNNDRNTINPLELDIYVPQINVAVEYHGLYWHSYDHIESSAEKRKHYDKCDLCSTKGIRLIQIFENEWVNNTEIVRSILRSKLGIISNKIYARKCDIIEIDNIEYKNFMEHNHIQGHKTSSVKYGLVYKNNLVSVMSFNKHPKYEWEITRFANKLNTMVVGGASKLFKKFIDDNNPNQMITYADRRYSDGNLYKKLSFKLDGVTKPNYCYIKNKRIFSRQQFMKHKLKDKLDIFDPNLTESENMFNNGYRRLWDAGNYRFMWECK